MKKEIYDEQTSSMITTAATLGLDSLVRNFGGRFENILSGRYSSVLKSPSYDRYISLEQYASLLETASEETGTPSLGFIFGYHFNMQHFGPVGYALGFSRNLGDALTYFCEHFDCIQEDAHLMLEESGEDCILSYRINGENGVGWKQDAETTIGLLVGFCKRMTGSEWRCRELHFEHTPEHRDDLKTQITGIAPEFGQKTNAIIFPKALLKHPMSGYDPWLLELVKKAVEESGQRKKLSLSVADEVYRTIWNLLVTERDVDLVNVAGEMGVSPRTIQSHLTQSRQTFRKLRSEAVLDRASELLSGSAFSITDIAYRLGYSESSAFSRAFTARYGMSPVEFRRTKRKI